jgi:hypothetical protein
MIEAEVQVISKDIVKENINIEEIVTLIENLHTKDIKNIKENMTNTKRINENTINIKEILGSMIRVPIITKKQNKQR